MNLGGSSSGSGVLTATSPTNPSLLAVHTPTPSTHGSTQRLSVRLYDAVLTYSLRSTLVASVDLADGPIVQLALEGHADPAAAPGFLAARLRSGPEDPSHRDKVVVWDLTRGVVACTLTAPAECSYRAVSCHAGRVLALTVNTETGKTVVMEHDVTTDAASAEVGQLKRKIKCSTLDEDELPSAKLGMAMSGNGSRVAVRVGESIRVLDYDSGKKLTKCKVKGDTSLAADGASSYGSALTIPVLFSFDAMYVATVTASGLAVFATADGGKAVCTVKSSEPVGDASIRNIEGGKYAILTVEPTGGRAYLSELTGGSSSSGGSKKKDGLKKISTLQCPSDNRGVVAATFHAASPGAKIVVLAMPTADAAAAGGAAIDLCEVSYRDEDGKILQGDIAVGSNEEEDDDVGGAEGTDGGNRKKRKALPTGELVLGPGEGGGEAIGVTDHSSKRSKISRDDGEAGEDAGGDDDEDDFVLPDDDAEEEAAAAGGTIADRLARLTSEIDQDVSDDDFSEDEDAKAALFGGKGKKKVKATSESLATLLRQALSSNDDSQLEVALHVSDKKVIENSIAALAKEDEEAELEGEDETRSSVDGGLICALLTKLVSRLARKPGRAEELSVWIRTVLLALISSTRGGKKMSKNERDVAAKLAPLRNMLNERVESLPHLLRLEGRLSLLGQN